MVWRKCNKFFSLTSLLGCYKPVESKAGPIHGFKTITLKFWQWACRLGFFRFLNFCIQSPRLIQVLYIFGLGLVGNTPGSGTFYDSA